MSTKLAITAAIVLIGLLGTVAYFQATTGEDDVQLKTLFKDWQVKHGKYYNGPEQQYRYSIFVQNYQYIQEINSVPRNYTLGLNQFTDLTNYEFATLYLGYKKSDIKASSTVKTIESAPVKGNTTLDWRQLGAVTPIKDQGQCGSCWTFSTTGALEGLNYIKSRSLQNFSEQQLVDCAGPYGNFGCGGGCPYSAMQYTADNGIALETAYPYKGVDGNCNYNPSNLAFKNSGVNFAMPGDASLASALASGPVSIAIAASTSTFQSYQKGILDDPNCGSDLDHAVLAVGYNHDATTGLDYWIIKNSWNTWWGEQGYLRLSRHATDPVGTCGINSYYYFTPM